MYTKQELITILNLLNSATVKGEADLRTLLGMIDKTKKMIEETKEE